MRCEQCKADPHDANGDVCVCPKVLYSVGLYLADRAYGGPEEGGWWYNCGELVTGETYFEIDCLPSYHTSETEAIAAREEMQRACEILNEDRREISSVLSEGRYQAEIWEGFLPLYYPNNQPHYE